MTNTEAKNAAITTAIYSDLLINGDVKAAFDRVLGEGAYNKLAGELWEELRK